MSLARRICAMSIPPHVDHRTLECRLGCDTRFDGRLGLVE